MITGCIAVSVFASLLDIFIGITSSAIRLEVCALTARFRKYEVNNKYKKTKKEPVKIVLLAKTKSKSQILELQLTNILVNINLSV